MAIEQLAMITKVLKADVWTDGAYLAAKAAHGG